MKTLLILALIYSTQPHATEKTEKVCWRTESDPKQVCKSLTEKEISKKLEELRKTGGVSYILYPDRMPKK